MNNDTSSSRELLKSFDGVLNSLTTGEDYKNKPPRGPPATLASLSEDELNSLKQTVYGENLDIKTRSYSEITINVEGDMKPKNVVLPKEESLSDINICGIDGSNQRINRNCFYFIISRASLVNFRYSKPGYKPYFYTKNRDSSGVVWVDGNVFNEDVSLHSHFLKTNGKLTHILPKLDKEDNVPFLIAYDPSKSEKRPSAQALGWGVKIQQALELSLIKKVPVDIQTICIRDGPLFSTSVSPQDNISGLNPIFAWKNQILISCSKRIADSTLIVEALLQQPTLRDYWFPNQNITDQTLNSVATDSLLLPKILSPGQRTPLMAAVPLARQEIVKQEKELMPLTCYYYRRLKPHNFIRLELPKFMWEKNKELVDKAIEIVAWQHELGKDAPLVQAFADKRCQLSSEKIILKKQTAAALKKKNLEIPEGYDDE